MRPSANLNLRVEPATVTAAGIDAGTVAQGVMLCLRPPTALAERIAIPSGDKPSQLHVTLIYFGALNEIDQSALANLRDKLPWIAANLPQIGVAFNRVQRLGDNQATVLVGEDNSSLVRWRDFLSQFCVDYIQWIDRFTYLPHMTLGYWMTDAEAPEIGPYHEAVSWVADSIYLSVGPSEMRFPLDTIEPVKDAIGFATEEFACHSAACAPPPGGTGGSLPGGGSSKRIATGVSVADLMQHSLHTRPNESSTAVPHLVVGPLGPSGNRLAVLIDGNHRLASARATGQKNIDVLVDTSDQSVTQHILGTERVLSPVLMSQLSLDNRAVRTPPPPAQFWTPRPAVKQSSTSTPTRRFKFKADGGDYIAGDDRVYNVSHQGRTIGIVEPTWLPSSRIDGDPTRGWAFVSDDRKMSGEGKTRGEAVANAFKDAQAKSEVSNGQTASADPTLSVRIR